MSVTYLIIAACCIVSYAGFQNREFFYRYSFNPYSIKVQNQWYRFFTHAFLHADWFHLLLNMYVLYMFGRLVEQNFINHFEARGVLYFILLYVGGILFSTLQAYRRHRDDPGYNSIGASGAVSAVVLASIIMYPIGDIVLIFLPFLPIPAFVFGLLYLLGEAWMARNRQSRIAHDAHLLGGIFGLLFTLCIDYRYLLDFIEKLKLYFGYA